jgi:predicted kinase
VDLGAIPEPIPAATRSTRRAAMDRTEPTPDQPENPEPARALRLELPRRAFIVVGGMPGAGKSTMLHRLRDTSPRGRFSVRDPEDIRLRWERVLGGRRHYRLWRPLVYVEHYVRLLAALPGGRTIILHDTATRGWARRVLAGLARLSRRPATLLWIDVSLAESLDGQRVRGREVPEKAQKRHWRRWARQHPADRRAEPGYAAVHTLTREEAAALVLAPAERDPKGR